MMGDENNLRGRPRKGKSKSDLILEKIYVADSDVGQLAESLGLSLGELVTLIGKRSVMESLCALRELADAQCQLLLSRCRVAAALTLASLSSQEEDEELARKASVDLLKLNLLPIDGGGANDKQSSRSTLPMNVTRLRKAFEKASEGLTDEKK